MGVTEMRTSMPKSRYDKTINCTPDNPLTAIQRGAVKVAVRYSRLTDPNSDLFIEVRLGDRRQRTAFIEASDHTTMLAETLELLGFLPTVISTRIDFDEDYGDGE
jgi:hypothetical protein